MAFSNGRGFSTKDRDNDSASSNCAQVRGILYTPYNMPSNVELRNGLGDGSI